MKKTSPYPLFSRGIFESMIFVGFSLKRWGLYDRSMDDCHQVSPRTGKPLEATQGTRKVPRLREKGASWAVMFLFFFFVSGIMALSFIQAKPWDFLKKKNDMVSFWNQGKIAKGRPLCWPKIEFIAALPPGFVGSFFFPPWLSSTPWVWPVTPGTRGCRSTSDFWSFTSGSCQENVDLGGEKMRRKIPWGDD